MTGVDKEKGRWYRVRVYGLAQPDLAVEGDELFIKVEFFKDGGKNSLDFIKKSVYAQVERERKSLADTGTNRNLGPATWRNYSIDVRTPFADVEALKVSVGFANGIGKGKQSEFWVADVDVTPIRDPADYIAPVRPATEKNPPALERLVKLGGRWYFDPRGGSEEPPKQFDHTNVDRLYYLTDRLEPVFVGNTSAWLRRGYLDHDGKTVETNQFLPDSVVLSFTETHLVMKSKNLPNHPVAVFPDRTRYIDGNPNVIQEKRDTWYIPLEPKPNPSRPAAMTMENKLRSADGADRGGGERGGVLQPVRPHCRGGCRVAARPLLWAPQPEQPVSLPQVPRVREHALGGRRHQPLPTARIRVRRVPCLRPLRGRWGAGEGRKEPPQRIQPAQRRRPAGPHYHVTPGKFPHIIGGYWGEVETRNRPSRRGPPN